MDFNYTSLLDYPYILYSLSAILISRFILDLRDLDPENSTSLKSQSNIQFASRMVGNMGASLSDQSIWMQGAGDNIDCEDENVESQTISPQEYEMTDLEGIYRYFFLKDSHRSC